MKRNTSPALSRPRNGVRSGSKVWTLRQSHDLTADRALLRSTRTMHLLLLTHGAQAPDAALTLNRVALGAFFAISGYHKLFNSARHATLTRTLEDDGVHGVPMMQWLLPSGEFLGGWALILGFLSV